MDRKEIAKIALQMKTKEEFALTSQSYQTC